MFDFFIIYASIDLEGEDMEKITTEILLTTLFKYGFEKVDPVLYSLVLENIAIHNAKTQEFDLVFDVQVSKAILKEGQIYRLNDAEIDKKLWYEYHYSDELYKYFDTINFEEIVFKKVKAYKKEVTKATFSQKEIDIIKTANNKTQSSLDELIEKQKLRVEETNKMASSTEYIEWLIDFTKKNNDQIYDDDINNAENISEEDKKKARNLYILFDIISEYSDQYKCKDGYYCKIKYNDEVLNIGVLHGLTVTHFVSLVSKTDELGNPKIGYDIGATEYFEIIEKYKKYNKSKVYKKD